MKRAFTLIELLVVIAIIAILAAILFPVFAQAKLAAKKTRGLSQAKQLGLAAHLYMGDYDDVLPGYRFSVADSAPPINPFYLSLPNGDPRKATLESQGVRTIHAAFFNQLFEPYTKSKDLALNTENPEGWVNFQDKDLPADNNFHSYGGQNNYAVNNYLLKSNQGAPGGLIAEPSNTLLMVDATYYNALPAQPKAGMCTLNGYTPGAGTYDHYWKHLGNNEFDFNNRGVADPDDPSNAVVFRNIEARYGGILNVVRADSSAKGMNARALVYDLRSKGEQSIWNPLKTACE